LVEVIDRATFASVEDLRRLLPAGLPPDFTTADLAAGLGRPRRVAQQLAYCLMAWGSSTPSASAGTPWSTGSPSRTERRACPVTLVTPLG
jgi:hypothetical protein